MINHIINECNKLEYKWSISLGMTHVGMVIHRKLCKKLKFDHTTKRNIHKPESVQENDTYKVLWDFEIQTLYQISVRRPDLIMRNKKRRTYCLVDFAVPADHKMKIKVNKM